MSESVFTFIGARKFVDVAPVGHPAGAYVEHNGNIYPASSGYPLGVLVDQAGKPGQLVLVPHEQGVIAALAGTRRVSFVKRDEENPDALHMALLRMHLASSSFMPVGVGQVDGVPCEVLDPNTLSLPPVIYPRKTILGMVAAFSLVAICGTGAFFADQYSTRAAQAAAAEAEEVRQKTEATFQQINQLKAQIGNRSVGQHADPAEQTELPEPIQSITDTMMAFPPDVTLRITNGQIQTAGPR